jgi:hypothetical protein
MSKIVTKRVITEIHTDAPYLVRWSLWLPFGRSVKLHQILRADSDRCSHDHPWRFWRIILKGGYTEVAGSDNKTRVLKPWRPWAFWRIYFCRKNFRHRITELTDGPSWTLVLCGRAIRRWGFFTKGGWMHWKDFVNEAWAKRVLWCDDGRELK